MWRHKFIKSNMIRNVVQRNTVALSDILLSVTHVWVQLFCLNNFCNEMREDRNFPMESKNEFSFFHSQQQNYAWVFIYFPRFYPNEYSRQILMKVSLIKLHENPSSSNQVVPCRQMDLMKPIVTFRNHAKAPEKSFTSHSRSNLYGSSRRIHKVRIYVTLKYTDR